MGKEGLNIPGDFVGALQRSSIRELQVNEEITLILIRQKTARHSVAEEDSGQAEYHEQRKCDSTLADQNAAPTYIACGSSLEHAVEPVEKFSQRPSAFCLWAEQQRGECGTETQRVKCR